MYQSLRVFRSPQRPLLRTYQYKSKTCLQKLINSPISLIDIMKILSVAKLNKKKLSYMEYSKQ